MPRKKRDPSVIWEEGDQPEPVTKANPLEGIELKVLQAWLDNSPSVKQAYETPRLRHKVEQGVRAAVFAAWEEEIKLRAQGFPQHEAEAMSAPRMWTPPTWPTRQKPATPTRERLAPPRRHR